MDLIRREELADNGIPLSECTVDICPIENTAQGYVPSKAGNLLFVVIFGLCILPQLFFGVRRRTWGFMIGMIGGLILELVGYIGRVQLSDKPFKEDPFMIQIVTLTIAPAFLAAALYLCLGRIVVVYGEHFSRLKPRTYSILFISCDFFSLLLQAIGGAMASVGDMGSTTQDAGINIMIAGLAAQVVSLALYMALCLDFAWRARKNRSGWSPRHATLRGTFLWKAFIWGLVIATLAIFVRCVYRVAELSGGFESELATHEPSFMIMEPTMIAIAVILLTVLHPAIAFQGSYAEANFSMRGRTVEPKESGVGTPEEMAGP